MDLHGKHVLITGASTGIGKALAQALLTEGARVTSFDLVQAKTGHPRWVSKKVDVTKSAQIRIALKGMAPIDILIQNAGMMRRGTLFQSSEEDFDLLFSVHVKGAWLLLKHAQPLLRKRAMIVQMCSRHANAVDIDPGLYSLSKRCSFDLAELLARTCPSYTVKILCPGPVDTAIARYGVSGAALKRKERVMRSPEEFVPLILRLLKDDRHSRLLYDDATERYRLV